MKDSTNDLNDYEFSCPHVLNDSGLATANASNNSVMAASKALNDFDIISPINKLLVKPKNISKHFFYFI